MPPIRQPVDFVAYRPDGRRIAAIEVKLKANSTPQWATDVRAGVLSRSDLSEVLFVIVALDRIYLWFGVGDGNSHAAVDASAPPTQILDTSVALAWYFAQVGVDSAGIHALAFEALVGWWLDDLSSGSAALRGAAALDPDILSALAGSAIGHQAAA